MFQSFDASTAPDQGPPRLTALREQITADGLDGFLVPRADAHQGEYVADRDQRLAWLTGFTGSAGFAAVLTDIAGVFIDGRYTLQVRDQVAEVFTPVAWPATKLGDWLAEKRPAGGRIGFDPWLHTKAEVDAITKAAPALELVPTVAQIDGVDQEVGRLVVLAIDAFVCALGHRERVVQPTRGGASRRYEREVSC